MEEDRNLSIPAIAAELRREFDAFFSEEIVPGIIHNFANPLNGVMGRSRLLQRRIEDQMKKAAGPEGAQWSEHCADHYRILAKDADLVSVEAEKLSGLLQVLSEKFMALSGTTARKIRLADMLSLEMRFFDFYLEFKHNVKKTLKIGKDIPEITGAPADYALALSALIGDSIRSMEQHALKELTVSLGVKDEWVGIEILHAGVDPGGPEPSAGDRDKKRGILGALLLMKKYHARYRADTDGGQTRKRIEIPFR